MIRAFVMWCLVAVAAVAVAGLVCTAGASLHWQPILGLAIAVTLATIVAIAGLLGLGRLHPTNPSKGGESQ